MRTALINRKLNLFALILTKKQQKKQKKTETVQLFNILAACSTGSLSSNYEHRRASELLRNIQNISICMRIGVDGKTFLHVEISDRAAKITRKAHQYPFLYTTLDEENFLQGNNSRTN